MKLAMGDLKSHSHLLIGFVTHVWLHHHYNIVSQAHFNENGFEWVPQVITENSATKLKVAAAVEYGINRHASSDDLLGFSVIDCLPPDIIYYLLEGATPHEMKLMLYTTLFRQCGYFSYISTLKLIRLLAFNFGYGELAD